MAPSAWVKRTQVVIANTEKFLEYPLSEKHNLERNISKTSEGIFLRGLLPNFLEIPPVPSPIYLLFIDTTVR